MPTKGQTQLSEKNKLLRRIEQMGHRVRSSGTKWRVDDHVELIVLYSKEHASRTQPFWFGYSSKWLEWVRLLQENARGNTYLILICDAAEQFLAVPFKEIGSRFSQLQPVAGGKKDFHVSRYAGVWRLELPGQEPFVVSKWLNNLGFLTETHNRERSSE